MITVNMKVLREPAVLKKFVKICKDDPCRLWVPHVPLLSLPFVCG